jgi:proline dehydrogenase
MKNKKSSSKSIILILPLLILTIATILLYKFGERWLRSVLIYLSHAAWARKVIENLQISRSVARRFVAGETIDEAMSATSSLNSQGMAVTLDFLGESVTDRTVAISARDEILRLLDRIEEQGLEANVSVKLSQLGLRIEKELALANMRQILARATQYGNKVRIDMEESELVDITLDIYHQLLDKYEFQNVGIVIQSYLYRSETDVAQLIEEGAWVR